MKRQASRGAMHLILDSSGLSICGEGEWAAARYGERGRRGWRKRHLIVHYAEEDGVSLAVGFYCTCNALGRLLGTILSGVVFQAAGMGQSGLMACIETSLALVVLSRVLCAPLRRAEARAPPGETGSVVAAPARRADEMATDRGALALLLAGPPLSLADLPVIRGVLGTKRTLVHIALVGVRSTLAEAVFGAAIGGA